MRDTSISKLLFSTWLYTFSIESYTWPQYRWKHVINLYTEYINFNMYVRSPHANFRSSKTETSVYVTFLNETKPITLRYTVLSIVNVWMLLVIRDNLLGNFAKNNLLTFLKFCFKNIDFTWYVYSWLLFICSSINNTDETKVM